MEKARFIGGVGEFDLWIMQERNVLIVQGEGYDQFMSFFPSGALIDVIEGHLNNDTNPGFPRGGVGELTNGERIYWGDRKLKFDKVAVARFVAVFAPNMFTDEERNKALGFDLTLDGEIR